MKRTIILAAMMCFAITSFAFEPVVNDRVLKTFKSTFTTAEQVKWYEFKDYYSVRFIHNEVRTVVNYNKDGSMRSATRTYSNAEVLPLHIMSMLKKEFPHASLFGVTEITMDNEMAYYVKLESSKHWYTIRVSPSGDMEMTEKYRKA